MTLSQLKQAIARVQPYREGSLANALSSSAGWAVADAWRAAFDWHAQEKWIAARQSEWNAEMDSEYEEGMRLIGEKLR
jgi:hypothetical protein